MTIDEAKHKLRYAVNEIGKVFTPQQMDEMREALKIAEDAMGKQISLKVLHERKDIDLMDGCIEHIPHYYCPSCNVELIKPCRTTKSICPRCGQKLDWRDH